MTTFIGASTRRFEDARFLTGRATFVEDVNLPGQAWASVVRSPHAHAEITRVDTSAAKALTGVLGVFTYQDIADLGLLPCVTQVATVAPMIVPPRPALANGRVRHVGDPVAFIVAETREAARDAAELVSRILATAPRGRRGRGITTRGAATVGHRARQSVVSIPER